MKRIEIYHPSTLVFGPESAAKMAQDFLTLDLPRLFILTIPGLLDQLLPVIDILKSGNISVKINLSIKGEPTFSDFLNVLAEAREFQASAIAGIGGGSVMDVAKLVATQLNNDQSLDSIIGNGLIKGRKTRLICMPSTAGTGSEVSPNSILIDDNDGTKKGIISPFLVPDAVYIDPSFTLGLPSLVSAYTGIDALTHCIEAYANKFAHPVIDLYALEGIRLISQNLVNAVKNGSDLDARTNVSLGSMYGGMCLGPVNTGGVHALAYPLSTRFKIPHGLSIAVLLPYVMEYNIKSATKRYAEIAAAMGAEKGKTDYETAKAGIQVITKLLSDCNLPGGLLALGVPIGDLDAMASEASEIQRLLKNNVREISVQDARTIYESAY